MKIFLYTSLGILSFVLGRMHAARSTIETKLTIYTVVQTMGEVAALALTR